MSVNKEDEYFSGTSLDVAEQHNPPATGPVVPGPQGNTKSVGTVTADNGNGKASPSLNKNKTKSKEVIGTSNRITSNVI